MENKMQKSELLELVKEIMNPIGKTEKEIDILISQLQMNVPHPDVSDLIYFEENTAEEVVEKALNYKVIPLLPPSNSEDDLPS